MTTATEIARLEALPIFASFYTVESADGFAYINKRPTTSEQFDAEVKRLLQDGFEVGEDWTVDGEPYDAFVKGNVEVRIFLP